MSSCCMTLKCVVYCAAMNQYGGVAQACKGYCVFPGYFFTGDNKKRGRKILQKCQAHVEGNTPDSAEDNMLWDDTWPRDGIPEPWLTSSFMTWIQGFWGQGSQQSTVHQQRRCWNQDRKHHPPLTTTTTFTPTTHNYEAFTPTSHGVVLLTEEPIWA